MIQRKSRVFWIFSVPLFLVLSLLSGCGERADPVQLPVGTITVSGILSPVELSSIRRGTHMLFVEGREHFLVESPVVHLQAIEDVPLTFVGHVERNIDSDDFPVFVVESVLDAEEETRLLSLPSFGLQVHVPIRWKMQEGSTGVHFFLSGSTIPFLAIRSASGAFPAGLPLTLAGHPGVRLLDDRSGQDIYLRRGIDRLILFSYDGQGGDDVRAEFLHFLQSLTFDDIPQRLSSGSGTGLACGGEIGLLCPSGQYCSFSSLQETVGHCVSL